MAALLSKIKQTSKKKILKNLNCYLLKISVHTFRRVIDALLKEVSQLTIAFWQSYMSSEIVILKYANYAKTCL